MLLSASAPLYERQQHQKHQQHHQQHQVYEVLHPPGWCLVPGLEQRHRDTWAGLRSRLLGADTRATTLLQILVTIQV